MKRLFTLFTLLLLFIWQINAQVTITGQVKDQNGNPIPGANVLLKGTTQGTITDADGNYSFVGVPANSVLQFSFVGMLTQEIPVSDQTIIDVTLEEDILGLDEVVVIGYGAVKRKDLTGAVASVKSEDIAKAPVTNTVEAIQGRVAGLDISRDDGRAGSGMSILLRGSRSIKEKEEGSGDYGDEPIYIIDGIQGDIDNLNPNDIVSIDVLKDASSTAIYGAKGANGVIMITTKKAEKGQMQVDFSSYVSINGNPSFPKPLQGDAWIKYLEEGYRASYGEEAEDSSALFQAWGQNYDNLKKYLDTLPGVDWIDEALQTGIQHNTNLSIRAGNQKVQSSFSIGYNKVEGIYKNDYLDKLTLRENLNIDAKDWVNFGIITGLTYQNREQNKSRINKAFGMMPLGEVYNDSTGEINKFPIRGMTDYVSILANDIEGTYRNNKKSMSITANPYIEIIPFKGLSIKSVLGTSLSSNRQGEFKSDSTYMMLAGSEPAIRNARYATHLSYNYTWENILNYNTSIAEKHNIGATFITSYENNQWEEAEAYNENFSYNEYLFYNLDAGINPSVSSYYEGSKRMSYAGRLNYNFMGKYIITGSVRYDGVSMLLETWDVFPSGAVAWRISEERFMDWSKSWLSNLKLRGGYGVAGSYNIDPYSTKTEVTNGEDGINLGGGELQTIIPTQSITTPKLGWEKTYSTNIGLDIGLFDGRIDGAFEWYNQDSKHLIYDRNLPYSNGGFAPKTAYKLASNIASMNNKGIEITLNTRNIQTANFKWNTTLTFSRNWNKIVSIELPSGATAEDLISEGLFIGEPRDVHYSYKKIGIWQIEDSSEAKIFGLKPGDVKIESSLIRKTDTLWYQNTKTEDDKDTTIYYSPSSPYTINADDDRQILGQEKPKWIAGFQNTFYYKGIDLSIFITARWGHMIKGELMGYFDHGDINIPDNYNYWTETNSTNDYPRPYKSRNAAHSDPLGNDALLYVDASYFKVKNITLGYTLPDKLMNRFNISNLRVYSTVYNSFIYTKSHLLKGIDPESGASDSFPLYKQLVFGIEVSF